MNQDNLLIAHSQEVYLHGLLLGIKQKDDQVIKSATTGIDALQYVIEAKPKLALLDVKLPLLSAFDIMKTASEKNITTKFIILFPDARHEYLVAASSLKVSGTLHANDGFKEINKCIERVLDDRTYFSKQVPFESMAVINGTIKNFGLLSETEKQILRFIGAQKTSNDIAEELEISKRTIEKHRSNIINKLHLDKKTNSLTKWVIKNELLVRTLNISTPT